MSFFDYNKKVSFTTHLSLDECIRRLQDNTDGFWSFKIPLLFKTKPVFASIKNDSVCLLRRPPLKLFHYAIFPAFFYGKLTKQGDNTRVEGTFKIPLPYKILLFVSFVFFLIIFYISEHSTWKNGPVTFLIAIFAWTIVLSWCGFIGWRSGLDDIKFTIKFLSEHLDVSEDNIQITSGVRH